ncbi:MAG: hypothetical protein AAF750_00435 [Planctomycetota bacterium]
MRRLFKHLPRFRAARLAMRELAAREGWHRERMEAYQLERLNAVWERAFEETTHYRALRDRLGLPVRFESLEAFTRLMPVLEKGAVRDAPERFCSIRAGRDGGGEWHRTSGSSGSRTSIYYGATAHRETLRAKYRFYQSWGVDFYDRWVFVWGNAGALAPGIQGLKERVRGPVMDWARGRLRLSPYDLRASTLRGYLERIARFKPRAIYSHSMAAHLLAEEAERMGWQCPSLRLVVLTAEPVRPATVAVVERALGVPAVAEYGCTECEFLAGHDGDRRLRVRDDLVFVETLPREDGAYDVVVSVLGNGDFPLLRYRLGDVCDGPIDRSAVGFAVLPAVRGRDFDLVMDAAGDAVHGQAFEDVVDKYDGVRRWRAEQDESGAVTVWLECHETLGEGLRVAIERRLAALVPGFGLVVREVDVLPARPGGKHRTVVSALGRRAVATPAEANVLEGVGS